MADVGGGGEGLRGRGMNPPRLEEIFLGRWSGLFGSSLGDSSEFNQGLSQDGQMSSLVAILPVLTWK